MHVTHSYLGTTRGRFRCLFFLLVKDYIEAESDVARGLDGDLERFARNMKDGGALVRPFKGDIESTRTQVLEKNWRADQRQEITRTPGLLAIEVDFDSFDPQEHRWLYIVLDSLPSDRLWSASSRAQVRDAADMLHHLAEAVADADTDVFHAAHTLIHDVKFAHTAKVFEAKPGIFGFSIDLVQGAQLVHQLWLRLTKGKRVFPATVRDDGWTRCPGCGRAFTIRDRNVWDGRKHRCGTYLHPQSTSAVLPNQ